MPPFLRKKKASTAMTATTNTIAKTMPTIAPAERPAADVDEDAADAVVVVEEEPELEVVVVTGHGQ